MFENFERIDRITVNEQIGWETIASILVALSDNNKNNVPDVLKRAVDYALAEQGYSCTYYFATLTSLHDIKPRDIILTQDGSYYLVVTTNKINNNEYLIVRCKKES